MKEDSTDRGVLEACVVFAGKGRLAAAVEAVSPAGLSALEGRGGPADQHWLDWFVRFAVAGLAIEIQ